MEPLHQGSIVKIADRGFVVLVLSRAFFNKSGMVVVCPLLKKADTAALNIFVHADDCEGYAIIDQMRSIDVRARHYSVLGEISYDQIQDISDAVQDIFSYYPF